MVMITEETIVEELTALIYAAGPVPFTERGVYHIEQIISSYITENKINATFNINPMRSLSVEDRLSRKLPNITINIDNGGLNHD